MSPGGRTLWIGRGIGRTWSWNGKEVGDNTGGKLYGHCCGLISGGLDLVDGLEMASCLVIALGSGWDCTVTLEVSQNRGLWVDIVILGRWSWNSRLFNNDTGGRECRVTVVVSCSKGLSVSTVILKRWSLNVRSLSNQTWGEAAWSLFWYSKVKAFKSSELDSVDGRLLSNYTWWEDCIVTIMFLYSQ